MSDRPRTCGDCKWCQTRYPHDTYVIWNCERPVPMIYHNRTSSPYINTQIKPTDKAGGCRCFDPKVSNA